MKDIIHQSSGAASCGASTPSRKQWLRFCPAGMWKALLLLLVLCIELPVFAQNIQVTGNVHDEAGEPIIGASVIVVGATTGVATDFDGNFVLNNVPSNGKLKVTYIGYNPAEVKINGQSNHDITLVEDSQVLDEVVVVGYGTMKKSDLTGSVSSVGTEKLNAKGAPSVLENLQGTTPGVNITKSTGRANGSIEVEIRGKSSINSKTVPIYVVDGVICGDIDFLNPQDIERIDVLKDASSTAIYGSRATAGVIMVTTKGGLAVNREQAPSISYDGYYGISKAAHLPNFMDGQEFYNYRFRKFGQSIDQIAGTAPLLKPQTIYGYTRLSGGLGQALLQVDQSDPQSPYVLKELLASGETYDWPSLVLKDGHQQNHYVSVNGGTKSSSYHFGLGINDESGLYEGDKSTTISFKGSLDSRINKVISAGFTFNMAYMNQGYANDNAVSGAWRMNPFMIPYNDEGEIIHLPGYSGTYGTNGNEFSKAVSPLDLMRNGTHNRKTYRLIGNAYIQLDIINGLNIKSTFAPSYSSYRDGTFVGYANPNEPGKTYGGDDLNTATATVINYHSLGWIWDNVITYQKTINRDHSINAMGLFSMESNNNENYKWVATDVIENTDWWNMGSGTTDNKNSSSSYSEGSMISYALRLNYGYKGRYMLTGTVRWDGSSKFADGYRWGSFPSAAAAWRISEESFMSKLNWVSNLKLRLSYGVTGNNTGPGNYATFVGIGGPVYYPFGTDGYYNGYYANGIADKSLSWETSHEFNVGLDFGFLKNRISGSVDWYVKNSNDLLYEVDLPLETGGVTMDTNIGKVRNTGVEVSLTTVNVESRDWNWSTTFTFAHNDNKVKEINGISDRVVKSSNNSLFLNHAVNNVYQYDWVGIVNDLPMTVPNHQVALDHGFTPGEQVRSCDYYYECYGLSEGRPIIRDVNGDGNIDEDDKVIWNSNPKWVGSLTSNLSYRLPKNGGELDFSFTVYSRQGGKVFSPFMSGTDDFFKTSDRGWQKIMVDYYIPAGTLIDCDGMRDDGTYINPVYQTETHYGSWPFPNATDNDGAGSNISPVSNYNTAIQVVDPSFVKVKNITLGYTFSKNLLKHIGCKNARIYCTITNPFVWSKYLGFDPEWANASRKNDGPSTVTYQIGANIKF